MPKQRPTKQKLMRRLPQKQKQMPKQQKINPMWALTPRLVKMLIRIAGNLVASKMVIAFPTVAQAENAAKKDIVATNH